MNVKAEYIALGENHIENISDLIKDDDIDPVLDKIDDIIISEIQENPKRTSDLAIKLENIYDDIFYEN